MIHTDEDDEFARIERENSMKGQPYHWEADAIKAAVLIEREACAKLCFEMWEKWMDANPSERDNLPRDAEDCANAIRARGQA